MITSPRARVLRATGIVLAAGQGTRFAAAAPGAPGKLLTPVDEVPMVRRTVASLLDGGAASCVVVVSADNRVGVEAALLGLAVRIAENPDPSRGMFSSIQAGLAAARNDDLCLVLPGDMPFVKASTVAAVIAEAEKRGLTVVASYAGVRGHPLALSSELRGHVLRAPVTSRLRDELSHVTSVCLDVDDPGVRRDVDRPSDLHTT